MNWDQYSMEMLKSTLERLEDKMDAQNDMLRKHMEEEDRRFAALEVDVAKVKQDLKWYAKAASGLSIAVAGVTNWMFDQWSR